MNFDLKEAAKKKILLAAHRGVSGGNIPCNTIPAYEIALKQGADMIEIDVEMGGDGRLYIFHPRLEPHHLYHMEHIPRMSSEEISRLRYVNYDRCYTQFGVETLDDVLETFRGRCFINVDKFWGHPEEIYQAIKRHNMIEQVVVKAPPTNEVLSVLEEVAPELAYMPLVWKTHPMHEQLKKSRINYVGAEVLFSTEEAEVASAEFVERMHKDDKLLWVNAIIYDYKKQLTAGHSDDTALCEDMDKGWGWLAKRGFDIIQTDWPGMMTDYLKRKNLLYKSN